MILLLFSIHVDREQLARPAYICTVPSLHAREIIEKTCTHHASAVRMMRIHGHRPIGASDPTTNMSFGPGLPCPASVQA